jgi:hypothetical protein
MRFLIGTFSWDPAAKAHMITYDKQLKDFTTMYEEEAILQFREGYEDLDPHAFL